MLEPAELFWREKQCKPVALLSNVSGGQEAIQPGLYLLECVQAAKVADTLDKRWRPRERQHIQQTGDTSLQV